MYGCESWTIKKAEHWRILNAFEIMVLEKALSPLDSKEIKSVHPKGNQSWIFIGRTDAEAETPVLSPDVEELTHLKRLWCWERLSAEGEGDDRGWDGSMASPTLWTWVWVNSESWWWTGRPGMLQSMGSQRVGHNWATELNIITKSSTQDNSIKFEYIRSCIVQLNNNGTITVKLPGCVGINHVTNTLWLKF